MTFLSLQFILFLAIGFFLYWGISPRYRNCVLCACNIIFILCGGFYVFIVAMLELLFSFYIAVFAGKRGKQILLDIGIIFLIFCMLILKFIAERVSMVYVPLGFSYYTLKGIGYLVDIRNGRVIVESNIINYAVAFLFFPCISSGPIISIRKFKDFGISDVTFSYDRSVIATRLILWGLYKKIVVADNLAVHVNNIYSNIQDYSGFVLVLSAFLYSIQLYCDFSGYCDIAIGIAKLFGIEVDDNFKLPYFSQNISDFWRRWNISLSQWLRDYIYIPIGGNKRGMCIKSLGIIAVFFISAIWHGTGVTFVIWGLLNAVIILLEGMLGISHFKSKNILLGILRRIGVFILATVLWIPFRLNSIKDILHFFSNCFIGFSSFGNYIERGLNAYGCSTDRLLGTIVVPVVILIIVDIALYLKEKFPKLITYSNAILTLFDFSIIVLILLLRSTGNIDFIYFSF